jgi:hypothetical protein
MTRVRRRYGDCYRKALLPGSRGGIWRRFLGEIFAQCG